MSKSIKDITFIGIFAALYAVLTLALAPISYGIIQFRVSDVLTIGCVKDKRLVWSFATGCLLANLFSPLGLMDIFFGTLATFLGCLILYVIKFKPLAVIASAASIAMIIGGELYIVYRGSLIVLCMGVFISELIALLIGYALMPLIARVSKTYGHAY